jgi:hypothetical protein
MEKNIENHIMEVRQLIKHVETTAAARGVKKTACIKISKESNTWIHKYRTFFRTLKRVLF